VETERDRKTDRQIDRHTDRHTNRQTHRHTDTHTDTQTATPVLVCEGERERGSQPVHLRKRADAEQVALLELPGFHLVPLVHPVVRSRLPHSARRGGGGRGQPFVKRLAFCAVLGSFVCKAIGGRAGSPGTGATPRAGACPQGARSAAAARPAARARPAAKSPHTPQRSRFTHRSSEVALHAAEAWLPRTPQRVHRNGTRNARAPSRAPGRSLRRSPGATVGGCGRGKGRGGGSR
jgi:hypothetical protein